MEPIHMQCNTYIHKQHFSSNQEPKGRGREREREKERGQCVCVCGIHTLSLPRCQIVLRKKIRWTGDNNSNSNSNNVDDNDRQRGKRRPCVMEMARKTNPYCLLLPLLLLLPTSYDCIGATKRVSSAFEENYYIRVTRAHSLHEFCVASPNVSY